MKIAKQTLIFILGIALPLALTGVFSSLFVFTEEMISEEIRYFVKNQRREVGIIAIKLYIISYLLFPSVIKQKYKITGYKNMIAFIFFYLLVCLIYCLM